MSKAEQTLHQALEAFDLAGSVISADRYGNGHINDTFLVEVDTGKRYIFQRISSAAFPHPETVMENMAGVTGYLRQQLLQAGLDADRGTLTLVPTKDGHLWFTDSENRMWRATHFIEETVCLERVETPEQFEQSARAFGRFQRQLSGYPADTLNETIARFHDTENRLNNFKKALAADILGRAKDAQAEIAFVLAHEKDCSVCMEALRQGKLPLRVTHNDTKLNNVLFDRESGEVACVIDLDTIMPGLSINDFGDSIRFGANHSAEDERDLSKVNFDPELYRVYARGFLEESADVLTDAEIAYMPWGAKLMTLECGMRFLTDYLEGDTYFHTTRPGQNLDRCRTQFKLVADMEAHWVLMQQIVQPYLSNNLNHNLTNL